MLGDRQEIAPFLQWLEDVRGMSPSSAADVVSRARRAERVLGEVLRDLAGQELGADDVAARLRERGEESKRVSDMRRGVQLYFEFARGR